MNYLPTITSAFRSQLRTSLVVGLENKPWAWTPERGFDGGIR